jgi:hypothetical protein
VLNHAVSGKAYQGYSGWLGFSGLLSRGIPSRGGRLFTGVAFTASQCLGAGHSAAGCSGGVQGGSSIQYPLNGVPCAGDRGPAKDVRIWLEIEKKSKRMQRKRVCSMVLRIWWHKRIEAYCCRQQVAINRSVTNDKHEGRHRRAHRHISADQVRILCAFDFIRPVASKIHTLAH